MHSASFPTKHDGLYDGLSYPPACLAADTRRLGALHIGVNQGLLGNIIGRLSIRGGLGVEQTTPALYPSCFKIGTAQEKQANHDPWKVSMEAADAGPVPHWSLLLKGMSGIEHLTFFCSGLYYSVSPLQLFGLV
ncbi:hypothetical protein IMZ48_07885 [Candidatus Bathyarchaeota archaeon]|nr:hypothetical protein [Candidatus Bathyarchaeota archaeon]